MKHWRPPWSTKASPARGSRKGYGGTWTRLSATIRENNPLCQVCGTQPSVEVHHKVAVKADPRLKLVASNLLAVCRECHERLEHPRQ